MSTPAIGVRRLHAAAKLPRYAHAGPFGDLAADLYGVVAAVIGPGETLALPTGLAFEFPAGFGALVEDRSGMALRGLTTLAGVIDPGYRGELRVVLTNLGAEACEIAAGDRIAQIRIVPLLQASFVEVETLTGTERGHAGFGSSGA